MGSGFWACIYICYSNGSSMVINLQGLDKYESNNTGDGQTDGETRMEVRTVNIYEFVRSTIMIPPPLAARELCPPRKKSA